MRRKPRILHSNANGQTIQVAFVFDGLKGRPVEFAPLTVEEALRIVKSLVTSIQVIVARRDERERTPVHQQG